MPIIKLDAIDSTNDYLKQLSKEKELENCTIVIAKKQTNGRGQMGAKWYSEPGKNLTMSVLFKDVRLKNNTFFDFNIAIILGVIKVLYLMKIPDLKIKWPNDIMAGGKKLGGILIENTLKSDGSFTSVVGLGLNVNQTNFEELPQATSLACITGNEKYNPEMMAPIFMEGMKDYLLMLEQNRDTLLEIYQESLFKLNYPCPFEDKNGLHFMGIIKSVAQDGKLALLQDDDMIHYYEVKEIKMLF